MAYTLSFEIINAHFIDQSKQIYDIQNHTLYIEADGVTIKPKNGEMRVVQNGDLLQTSNDILRVNLQPTDERLQIHYPEPRAFSPQLNDYCQQEQAYSNPLSSKPIPTSDPLEFLDHPHPKLETDNLHFLGSADHANPNHHLFNETPSLPRETTNLTMKARAIKQILFNTEG